MGWLIFWIWCLFLDTFQRRNKDTNDNHTDAVTDRFLAAARIDPEKYPTVIVAEKLLPDFQIKYHVLDYLEEMKQYGNRLY